jgi:hypothetical protein
VRTPWGLFSPGELLVAYVTGVFHQVGLTPLSQRARHNKTRSAGDSPGLNFGQLKAMTAVFNSQTAGHAPYDWSEGARQSRRKHRERAEKIERLRMSRELETTLESIISVQAQIVEVQYTAQRLKKERDRLEAEAVDEEELDALCILKEESAQVTEHLAYLKSLEKSSLAEAAVLKQKLGD